MVEEKFERLEKHSKEEINDLKIKKLVLQRNKLLELRKEVWEKEDKLNKKIKKLVEKGEENIIKEILPDLMDFEKTYLFYKKLAIEYNLKLDKCRKQTKDIHLSEFEIEII